MKKSNNPHLIIINNDSCRKLADQVAELIFKTDLQSRYDVDVFLSENVYGAVALLTKKDYASVLIIGTYAGLAKENFLFYDYASRRGYSCCCVLNENSENKAPANPDVHFVNKIKQLEKFITEYVQRVCESRPQQQVSSKTGFEDVIEKEISVSNPKTQKSAGRFNQLDFVPSKDEIEALLGGLD